MPNSSYTNIFEPHDPMCPCQECREGASRKTPDVRLGAEDAGRGSLPSPYEYGVLMKITSAKRLNKKAIREAFSCGGWSMEPFPCEIATEVLEIGAPSRAAELALRVFKK